MAPPHIVVHRFEEFFFPSGCSCCLEPGRLPTREEIYKPARTVGG
jgi:hypothetical protein